MRSTKTDQLFALLHKQYVSPIDSLNLCGVHALSQRISEWRAAGHVIGDKWVITPSGARHKAYRLLKAAQ